MDPSQWSSVESQAKAQELVDKIQQLQNNATATNTELLNQYSSLEKYTEALDQLRDMTSRLGENLDRHTNPDVYNPYYSMQRVLSEEPIDIDSSLAGSCNIVSTRRALSKLGIDIHDDATEEKIARIVDYSPITQLSSTGHLPRVYRHYGFEYNTYLTSLPIEEIDKITKQGHAVTVGLSKPNIGRHSLLIEEVTKTEKDDYLVTFSDPFSYKKVTLPYQELEKVLSGTYTFPSERQRKTLQPILEENERFKI